MQETLRPRNWKGEAAGLEHRDWGIERGGGKQNAFKFQKQILPPADTKKLSRTVKGPAVNRSDTMAGQPAQCSSSPHVRAWSGKGRHSKPLTNNNLWDG